MSAFEGFAPRGFSLDYRAVVARAGSKLYITMQDYFAEPGTAPVKTPGQFSPSFETKVYACTTEPLEAPGKKRHSKGPVWWR